MSQGPVDFESITGKFFSGKELSDECGSPGDPPGKPHRFEASASQTLQCGAEGSWGNHADNFWLRHRWECLARQLHCAGKNRILLERIRRNCRLERRPRLGPGLPW